MRPDIIHANTVFCVRHTDLNFVLLSSFYPADMLSPSVQDFADSTKLNSNDIPQLMQLVQKPSILGNLLLEEAKSIAANQKDDDVFDNDGINCELLLLSS